MYEFSLINRELDPATAEYVDIMGAMRVQIVYVHSKTPISSVNY